MESAAIAVIDLPPLPMPPMRANALRILEAVAGSYSLSLSELLSKDRHKCVAEARVVAYWLLRRSTQFSFPEIGRAVGGRDHTTVMHGVRSCQRRRDADERFRIDTDAMLEAVGTRMVAAV